MTGGIRGFLEDGMRAIVTGATGFTGLAVCKRLVSEGWDVTAFVRASPRVKPVEALGVRCVEVDITDAASVRRAMTPVDRVFHIAAMFRTEDTDRSVFHRVNVDAVEHVANACREAGVGRFIHTSTVGVQGQIDDPPADEEYRVNPNDHYQSTKWEGEQVARRHMANGLPGVVVRPAGIYGPGDMRFLKLFRAIDRGTFFMIGSGKALYHLTYIDDLVEGFMLAASRPEAVGRGVHHRGSALHDGAGNGRDRGEGAGQEAVEAEGAARARAGGGACLRGHLQAVQDQSPLYPRRVEFFTMDRGFTTEKAHRLLGYTPGVDIEEGLARTADWYRQEGLLQR
jgi:nucleoside-diphosphate-sugar epimerase